ncbi:MAG: phosphatase PAP2 family protein, partial [Luteimonas sp.]
MQASSRHKRFFANESNWCVRANGWAARNGWRSYFAAVSRLGDGLFWYALMAVMILLDGMPGLRASVHLAATGVIALTLYKL